MKRFLLAMVVLFTTLCGAKAAVDPNFHIYLCFGQSNMEGNAQWESIDNEYVDPRFQMLATTDFSNPSRQLGNWYTAYCPIVSPTGKLGPTDYFGRTMVAALPSDVKVGVVAVAMGGSPIEMFDKDKYQSVIKNNTTEWYVTLANNYYGGNPYGRLVEMAKKAQESGVIKGILLHQGCSNCANPEWPNMVKKIYNDLLTDLGLNAADVPLFVGEVERFEQGGGCSSHNDVVAQIPNVIPTGHVVSSYDCPGNGSDPWHFNPTGYRMLGRRYAYEVLRVMGITPQLAEGYTLPNNMQKFLTAKSLTSPGTIAMRVGSSRTIELRAVFNDNHTEEISNEATFALPSFLAFENGKFVAKAEGTGDVTATFTDFTGNTVSTTFTVECNDLGPNHVLVVNNGNAGSNPWDKQLITILNEPMVQGKTYIVKATIKADNSGDCALWPIWTTSPNRDDWGNSSDVQYLASYVLTSEFKEFTWEFSASFPNDRLQFVFGKIGGKVYFDDVSCMEKGTTNEMVVNGSFESDDLSKWSVISWGGQSMKIEEIAASGIEDIRIEMPTNGVIYDLSGRRVDAANAHKGIYIINGKKVIKK
ncbi:MAG: hypothetical protein IKX36_06050 [Prevotella sp.]|nr:hypothetical protein [Prevotella sp.]